MIDRTQVYDYYCTISIGKLISNEAQYNQYEGRSPLPSTEPAVGTEQNGGFVIHHDRFTTKLTESEYEELWGIDIGPPQEKIVIIRSAYKILDGNTEYDWVVPPVFADIEPYLPDLITYDNFGVEVSRRRPLEGESYMAGYSGSDPINV